MASGSDPEGEARAGHEANAEELRRLGDNVESLERELELARQMLRQATTRNASLTSELAVARRKLQGLRRRLLVRVALGVSRRIRKVTNVVRSALGMPVRKLRALRQRARRAVTQRGMRATTTEERRLLEASARKSHRRPCGPGHSCRSSS